MKSLLDLYGDHKGKVSDKWSIYLAEYNRIFTEFRAQPMRLLEIGLQNGGSLEIWAKYFPSARILVGCDVDSNCARLVYDDPRIQLVIGDANTAGVEKKILHCSAKFDLIIDDGSHTSGDIAKTFARYFRHLAVGGLFVAEDLHCSYWGEFEGGLHYPYSSMAFFKRLADVVNHEHWGIEKERRQLLRGFSEKLSIEFKENELAEIHSIEFFNSACVVRRLPARSNVLGERVIAGQQELVTPGLRALPRVAQIPSQAENVWASMISAPDEAWQQLTADLADRDNQVACLNEAIAERDARIASLAREVAALRSSTSWRLTKPLRFIGHQHARGRQLGRIASAAIRLGGGPGGAITKAVGIYRREGLSGLKHGIRLVKDRAAASPSRGSAECDRNDYREWVRRYDTIDPDARQKLAGISDSLAVKPKISIVLPTYNSQPEWLIEAIESVRNQIYQNWELCIADDASTDPAIRRILEAYTGGDERIKAVFREDNGHICAASNSALELATGEWVALLDHDDKLAEHALFYVACTILENPDATLIYSDEDKIDANGVRSSPYFKTDWIEDLLYSHNMFCHLGVYKKSILSSVGGFRPGFEGAQDYDLVLRCTEMVDRRSIVHIPKILYHWRAHSGSTADNAKAKPYAMAAGERAINDHFSRLGVNGRVELTGFGYRPRYDLPDELPKVSIIIPTKNGMDFVRRCVESVVEKTTYGRFEVVIVDNGSDDPEVLKYFESLSGTGAAKILRDDREFNYSALNNFAVERTHGEVICLMNNDIEVITPEWLSEMVAHALRPGVAVVGAKLIYPNNTLQHAGVVCGIGGWAGHAHKGFARDHPGYAGRASLVSNFSAVTAACLVMRRSLYLALGGLDEQNLKIACNDVDLCLRAVEGGYRNVWTPYAELYHHESATRGYEDTPEKRKRFTSELEYMQRRWGDRLKNDPAYNPNLTLDYEDFSLAWPPRANRSAPLAVRQAR